MPKRIALFILGFALAVGAFFLYRHFTGATVTGAGRPRLQVATGPAPVLPMTFESRNERGELEYLVTATQAEQIKDAAGKPLPGQLVLKNPVATFYDKNGRTLDIRADQCFVVMDQSIRPSTSGKGNLLTGTGQGIDLGGNNKGGKATTRMMSALRFGKLSGNVKLALSAVDPSAPQKADPLSKAMQDGFRVFFGGDVEFDGDQRTLRSTGPVTIDSEFLWFAGAGFELIFNPESRRVEFLRIDQGHDQKNRMIFRNVADRFMAMAEKRPVATTTAPAAGAAVALAPPTPPTPPTATPASNAPGAGTDTKPAKTEGTPPEIYQVAFGQNVEAKVGDVVMAMDRMHLLFTAGKGMMDDLQKQPGEPPATDTAAVAPVAEAGGPASAPATAPVLVKGPRGEPQVTKQDLELSWNGPLEMRPAAASEQAGPMAPGEVILQAIGTAEKPVSIANRPPAGEATSKGGPPFTAMAGRLTFHSGNGEVLLEPAAYNHVVLNNPTLGDIDCQGVRIDRNNNKVALAGPGVLTTRGGREGTAAASAEPTTVAWAGAMNLDLAEMPDPKNMEKKILAVRRAVIQQAEIRSPEVHVAAALMDVLLATVQGRTSQELEHFVATENVVVDALRRGGAPVPHGVPTDGLRASKLELSTRRASASAAPELSKLLATGEVSAWQYSLDDKNVRNDPTKMTRQLVTTARLETDLKPKAKTAEPAEGTMSLGSGVEWTRFVASEGVKVEIMPRNAANAILATAQSLEAIPDAENGTRATLTAAEDKDALVKIAMGKKNAMQGRTVILDERKKTIDVPGKGQFTMALTDKKTGKETPMQVEWAEHMRFDNTAKVAVFTGSPWARMSPDRPDEGYLKASQKLTVQLTETGTSGAAAGGGGTPGTNELFSSGELGLNYIEAEGRVDASGAEYGDKGERLARLRVQTTESTGPGPKVPERLIYREATRRFEIPGPGYLAVENNMPDKPGERFSSQGVLNFGWVGNFVYDGNANTITFKRDVAFAFVPKTAYKLPGQGGGAEQQIDSVVLKTDDITVRLTEGAPTTTQRSVASPIGLGGGATVSSVEARGANTRLIAGQSELRGNVTFDVAKKVARVEGVGEESAVVTRPGQGTVYVDEATWDMGSGMFNVKGGRGSILAR